MPSAKKLFHGYERVYFVIILMAVQLPHCVNGFLFAQEIRNVLLAFTSLQCCHRPPMKTTYVSFRTSSFLPCHFILLKTLFPALTFFKNSIVYSRTNYILVPIVSEIFSSFKWHSGLFDIKFLAIKVNTIYNNEPDADLVSVMGSSWRAKKQCPSIPFNMRSRKLKAVFLEVCFKCITGAMWGGWYPLLSASEIYPLKRCIRLQKHWGFKYRKLERVVIAVSKELSVENTSQKLSSQKEDTEPTRLKSLG